MLDEALKLGARFHFFGQQEICGEIGVLRAQRYRTTVSQSGQDTVVCFYGFNTARSEQCKCRKYEEFADTTGLAKTLFHSRAVSTSKYDMRIIPHLIAFEYRLMLGRKLERFQLERSGG